MLIITPLEDWRGEGGDYKPKNNNKIKNKFLNIKIKL